MLHNDFTEFKIIIANQKGLHARAAAKMVNICNQYNVQVHIYLGHQRVSGHSIMGLMLLAAGKGTELTVKIKGIEAETAASELKKLVENKFGEEDP